MELIESYHKDWQFTIDFPADEDDTSYVEVELDVDAYETVLRFHP